MNDVGWLKSCYRYVEGEERARYWVDNLNCLYYTGKDLDENGKFKGKDYWIIEDGIVDISSIEEDEEKEWDFENNRVKDKSI